MVQAITSMSSSYGNDSAGKNMRTYSETGNFKDKIEFLDRDIVDPKYQALQIKVDELQTRI